MMFESLEFKGSIYDFFHLTNTRFLRSDVPPGERPAPATNLTLNQEAGGWVLRWEPNLTDSNILYYTIEKKKDSQGEEWKRFAEYTDVEEASYMSK